METEHVIVEWLRTNTQTWPVERLLAFVARKFTGRIAFASSFGAEDQVLVDILAKAAPAIPVFTIDTGRLPQETLDLVEATNMHYGTEIEVLTPDAGEVAVMVAEHGGDLFYDSIESRRLCCHVRKVNVLKARLSRLDAWICGLRREQSVTRGDVQRIEWDAANGLVKINPLVDWTTSQVWDYIRAHNVPYNALHDRGYPSIGCGPCTRAVAAGEDIRAGRWWWEQPEHKECGLHVVDGRLVRKTR